MRAIINKAYLLRGLFLLGVFILVVMGYFLYRPGTRMDNIATLAPVDVPQIAGKIIRWLPENSKVSVVMALSQNQSNSFTFVFNSNVRYERLEIKKDGSRVLHNGNFSEIREGMYAELYLQEPLDYFKGFNVSAIIYR